MYERDSNEFVSGLKVCGGRWYSDTTTASRLSVIEVETRVLKVCKAYDKVVADKVCTFYLFGFFYYFRRVCGITVSSHH